MLLLYSSAVYEYSYVSTERCVPSALLLVSRPEPAPDDCSLATEGRPGPPAARASGAKQRRYTALAPSNSSIVVLLLFAVMDNILNFFRACHFSI